MTNSKIINNIISQKIEAKFSKFSSRIEIANLYIKVVEDCDWLISQSVSNNVQHSYWAFTLKIDTNSTSISWQEFRECFMKNGGKSFYGAWSLSYLEPSLLGMKFSDIDMEYKEGLCPIAESIQPNLIQLKTNFETTLQAEEQAEILFKTIRKLDKST